MLYLFISHKVGGYLNAGESSRTQEVLAFRGDVRPLPFKQVDDYLKDEVKMVDLF